MLKRLSACLLLTLSVHANATITGPTTSSTGSFTLSWGQELWETTSTGSYIGQISGTPHTFFRPVGTYYFEELYCFWQPFVGWDCFTMDTHQVSVSSIAYPESLEDQAAYSFQIRSGDFDSNGRTDLYVERLTPGPADGSMQSYVVWNNSNGTLSTDRLTSTYALAAQSAPINTTLNLLASDLNADGFADHYIERIDQVMGAYHEQEVAVFSPGTASNKERPQGSAEMTGDAMAFLGDIALWTNDENYFDENINSVVIPVFAVGYVCSNGSWTVESYGYFSNGWCYAVLFQVGTQTVQYGINFDSLAVSGYLDALGATTDPITDNDLWQISQVFFNVFGVHAFGFDTGGTRHTTNFTATEEEEERLLAMTEFWRGIIELSPDEAYLYPGWHEFVVDTIICSTSDSWCTLENIACWGRHYHAPNKQEGYAEPVGNGCTSTLGTVFTGDDPIITGVGTAAGLPEHAIGNITLEDHIFHNPASGQWQTCPQTVPQQGAGTPPQICNQVYREPYTGTDGNIHMRTRGSGWNYWPVMNRVMGPRVFKENDEDMIEAIANDPDNLCPSLNEPLLSCPYP